MSAAIYCPHCGSENVRYREKRDNWICDDCDHVFVVPSDGSNSSEKDTKKVRIFISYGHDVTKIVERIFHDLQSLEYDVWVDTAQIKSGDDWRNSIAEGILNSQVVLAMLSSYGLRPGGVCLDELAIAVGCNRNIIRSCLMDKDAEALIPSTINGTEYIDMTGWMEPDSEAFENWYAGKFQELLLNIQSAQALLQDPIIKEVELRLRPSLFSNSYTDLLKHVTERKWLSLRVSDWVHNDTKPIMLLTAYPGSGKTTFCAHHFHFDPLVACMAFCNHSVQGVDETSHILRNIAYQLAQSSIVYKKNLLWTLNNTPCNLDGLDLQSLFNLLICTPFRLEIDGQHAPMIIVIDGLDALDQNGRNTLSELIAVNSSKLPPFVHILISTRHSEAIINNLSNSYRVDVSPTSIETTDDLLCYLRYELPAISEEKLVQVAKKCRGSFLHASLYASAVRNGVVDTNDTEVLMPQIDMLYYQTMLSIFDSRASYNMYWRALALLIAAQGAMPMETLRIYMKWSAFEANAFFVLMMTFMQRWVDSNGCQWIGVVYPSFLTWLTQENKMHMFHIPSLEAHKEWAEAVWKRYCDTEQLNNYELTRIEHIFRTANMENRLEKIYHDTHVLHYVIERIKSCQYDPRQYETWRRLVELCDTICARVNTEESRQIANGELPFIKLQQYFTSSNYHSLIQYYMLEGEDVNRYCSDGQKLHVLYMLSTAYDFVGEREKAVEMFLQLEEQAIDKKIHIYHFYSLIGLLWNDHFNDLKSGQILVEQLNEFSTDALTEEDILMRKLIVARFNLSSGKIKEAFVSFKEVVTEDNSILWGYNTIAFRLQMLLIESLVAAYDNEEFVQGIDLGERIYAHIKDSLSISTCYCASWLVMNYIACGEFDMVAERMLEAENCYEKLSKISQSMWLEMHLKSVRSQIAIAQKDTKTAIELLGDVIRMAQQTNDAWVLGDAYFDLFCVTYLHNMESPIAIDTIVNNLQHVAAQSGLPHLLFKAKIVHSVVHSNEQDACALFEETKRLLEANNLASTNYFIVAYLVYCAYKPYSTNADELDRLIQLVTQDGDRIDRQNPGIHFVERNEIIHLLKTKHYERE